MTVFSTQSGSGSTSTWASMMFSYYTDIFCDKHLLNSNVTKLLYRKDYSTEAAPKMLVFVWSTGNKQWHFVESGDGWGSLLLCVNGNLWVQGVVGSGMWGRRGQVMLGGKR